MSRLYEYSALSDASRYVSWTENCLLLPLENNGREIDLLPLANSPSRGLQNAGATVASCTRIQAESAGSKSGDLQETTRHGDILQEMDHLILVAERMVKQKRRNHTEQCHDKCRQAGLISHENQY